MSRSPRLASLLCALVALVALAGPALARDVLPPGYHDVEHVLVLEGDAHGWRLVAAPTAGFGVREVRVGEPFEFSSKYGTRLWAFAAGAAVPERWEAGTFEGHALVADLPAEVASVPLRNPVQRVETHLALEGLADGELRLRRVSETRTGSVRGALGTMLPGALIGALVALGVVALLVVRRGRARTD
ncbi:MAG: hypothetical protein H6828_04240 [Planctomycetes bacterium]|nr:hypothetical protein [Planctomycetota bacterium]